MDISFFLILILRQFPQLWMNFIQATCLASFAHCIRKHAQQMPQYLSKFLSSRVRRFGSFQRVWRGRHTAISFATLTELYKMLQHHLIWKGSFSKKTSTNISYAYLSISDGFVHQFFFCLAVWLQLETRYTSPKAGSKESKTTPSSFHLLTNTEFQHAFSIQK